MEQIFSGFICVIKVLAIITISFFVFCVVFSPLLNSCEYMLSCIYIKKSPYYNVIYSSDLQGRVFEYVAIYHKASSYDGHGYTVVNVFAESRHASYYCSSGW